MIITQTPFRVSFLGGGTDYPEHFRAHGGAVLGTAITRSAFQTVMRFESKLFEYSIRLAYRQVECVKSLDDVQHRAFQACLRRLELTRDVEVNYAAELPSFTGLGTSSSFVVGLLNALHAFKGRHCGPMDLCRQAIEIERDVLGEAVGCQDQAWAAYGGVNLIEFKTNDDIIVHRVPLSPDRRREIESHLLLVYTGITRRAADVAEKQVRKCAENKDRYLKMRKQVDEGFGVLTGEGSLERLGALLHEGWLLKQSLDDSISNGRIGEIYKAGLAGGAWGGKLLGAGGGGFVLFVVPPEKKGRVREALKDLREIEIGIDAPGSRVIHAS